MSNILSCQRCSEFATLQLACYSVTAFLLVFAINWTTTLHPDVLKLDFVQRILFASVFIYA